LSAPESPKLARVLAGALVVATVAVIYTPTLDHELVYDDFRFIQENRALRDFSDPLSFLTDPRTVDPAGGWEGIYRPLRTLTFAVEVHLFGVDPGVVHATNALLHALNALLVLVLLRRLLPGLGGPLLGAFLFAAHPAAVEAVAFASSRDNPLFLAFLLPALLVYLRGRDGVLSLTALALLFALSLLGKETAVVLPALALLYELTAGAGGRGLLAAFADAIRRRWRAYAVLAVTLVVYLFVRYEAMEGAFAQRGAWWEGSSVATRSTAVHALVLYVGRAVLPWFPAPFPFDYQVSLVRSPSELRFLISAGLVLLTWLPLVLRRRFPRAAFFVGWFYLSLLPTANLLFPINILFADRFLYLASIAAVGLLATGLAAIVRRHPRTGAGLTLALASLFVGLSVHDVRYWRDPETLWRGALAEFPQNPRALRGLAFALRDDPASSQERRELLERAIAIEPDYPPARRDLAELLLATGNEEQAIAQHRALVERFERGEGSAGMDAYGFACARLADLYEERGRYAEAIAYARRLIPFRPSDPVLRMRIGELFRALGRRDDARRWFEDAISVAPAFLPARRALRDLEVGAGAGEGERR